MTSFKPTKSIYQLIKRLLTESTSPALSKLRKITAGSAAFGLQPISASAVIAGGLRGGNALGLTTVNQTWFHMDVAWLFAKDDANALRVSQSIIDDIEYATKAQDSYLPYIFMNDANEKQDVIAHYGQANARKLKAVQAKYDPKCVFQRLVPGGFKI